MNKYKILLDNILDDKSKDGNFIKKNIKVILDELPILNKNFNKYIDIIGENTKTNKKLKIEAIRVTGYDSEKFTKKQATKLYKLLSLQDISGGAINEKLTLLSNESLITKTETNITKNIDTDIIENISDSEDNSNTSETLHNSELELNDDLLNTKGGSKDFDIGNIGDLINLDLNSSEGNIKGSFALSVSSLKQLPELLIKMLLNPKLISKIIKNLFKGVLSLLSNITEIFKPMDFSSDISCDWIYFFLFITASVPFLGYYSDVLIILKAIINRRFFLAIFTFSSCLISYLSSFHMVDLGLLFKLYYFLDVKSYNKMLLNAKKNNTLDKETINSRINQSILFTDINSKSSKSQKLII